MKRFIVIIMSATMGAVCATQALAASDAHGYNWMDLFWRLINFALFVGILWWAGAKKISSLLRGRRDSIADEFTSLDEQKEEAKKQLEALSARIANTDAEREAILRESRAQAEAARDLIIDNAHRQAEEILAQARRSAENEARKSAEELRARVADEVVATVRATLAKRLEPAEHERLIDNALKKVVIQ